MKNGGSPGGGGACLRVVWVAKASTLFPLDSVSVSSMG